MIKKNEEALPENGLLCVNGTDEQGNLTAVYAEANGENNSVVFTVIPNKKIKPPLMIGDEFIGQTVMQKGCYMAKPIVRLKLSDDGTDEIIYGIIQNKENHYYLLPAEKNVRMPYLIDNLQGASEGDFVSAVLCGDRKFKQVRIVKNYGKYDLNKATSALILDKYKIPSVFEAAVRKELQDCPVFDESDRLDMTSVPLVTIDGEDSKDFDDAVWAEKTSLGFNLMVAIADVSFYVRPGSELDREAYKRGNSVYLPNMVVPMLPELLSNDLCSLNPRQRRASIVCLMQIDNEGNLISYDFKRAVIKSAARLTYREVDEALKGNKSPNICPVYKCTVEPVYEAYQALAKARNKRGALNLSTDELKIKTDKNGEIASIKVAEHYEADKIVEEFMVNANVAAALMLKDKKLPVMYRVHDKPVEEKMKDVEPLLNSLGMKTPDFAQLKPEHFNRLISKCIEQGCGAAVNDTVLRVQATAQYTPHNIGHFGLGLSDYVHFTSPIRRYADLLIHRDLVKALEMPEGGGLDDGLTVTTFEDIGTHLCETERRAVNAERNLTARFVSSYLQPSVGQDFEVTVTGMCQSGMFVRIDSLGAEGLIPLRTMPIDYYEVAPGNLEMTSRGRKYRFRLGDKARARLMEASPITGGLIFKYIDDGEGVDYVEKGHRSGLGFKFSKPDKKGKNNRKKRKTAIKKKNLRKTEEKCDGGQ